MDEACRALPTLLLMTNGRPAFKAWGACEWERQVKMGDHGGGGQMPGPSSPANVQSRRAGWAACAGC